VVKRAVLAGLLSLAAAACSREPTPLPECTGAVCGEVVDDPGEGGSSVPGVGGAGGQGGLGGHAGGHGGHMGGHGGCGAPLIHIVQPLEGSTVSHGLIDFEAHVECIDPAADQILWYVAGLDDLFAMGFTHTTAINQTGTWDLSVVIMANDTPVATDAITFSTN
jgi:hypothetical protein